MVEKEYKFISVSGAIRNEAILFIPEEQLITWQELIAKLNELFGKGSYRLEERSPGEI